MRILHINDNYKLVGGTEVYQDSLTSAFREKGHEIFHFAIDDEKDIEESNLFIYRDRFKFSSSKYIFWNSFDPSLYNRLRKWIKNVNPDIIHIHNNRKFTSSILLALNGKNVPVVQTVHDHELICPTSFCTNSQSVPCEGGFGIKCPINGCISWERYEYQQVPESMKIYLLKKNVNLLIAPSRALQNRLNQNGFQNVVHLPNFVDESKFKYNFNKMESFNVLYVGRLVKEKGINYILEAFPKIVKAHPSCILNIVGDGPLRSNLFHLANYLGIEKQVKFHGRLSGAPLVEEFQRANVVVISSIVLENSPLVVYEAMASGRPIVGSNIGGIPELIINGETGLLVEPKNSDQIAEKVIKLLSDRELTRIMGKKAADYCFRNYNKENHYKKLKIIYENVIQGKNFPLNEMEGI